MSAEELERFEIEEEKHYDYVYEVLGVSGAILGKSKKGNVPEDIGDWEYFLNSDRSGIYMEWVYKSNIDMPVYINPSEMWVECPEGGENQIGACLIDLDGSGGPHQYQGSNENTYDICEPFEWTYDKEKDLAEFIVRIKKFLAEVEEKHMDILCLHIDDMPA